MVFDCMFFGIIECCIILSILLYRGINEVCICYLIGMFKFFLELLVINSNIYEFL